MQTAGVGCVVGGSVRGKGRSVQGLCECLCKCVRCKGRQGACSPVEVWGGCKVRLLQVCEV